MTNVNVLIEYEVDGRTPEQVEAGEELSDFVQVTTLRADTVEEARTMIDGIDVERFEIWKKHDDRERDQYDSFEEWLYDNYTIIEQGP